MFKAFSKFYRGALVSFILLSTCDEEVGLVIAMLMGNYVGTNQGEIR